MFFYGNKDGMNVMLGLEELETAVLLLTNPTAALSKDGPKYAEYADMVDRVMETGGKFHITVTLPDGEKSWRKPLLEAPEPYRTRTENALGYFAERFGHSFRPEKVELIA